MTKSPSGVKSDHKFSCLDLERIAARVRVDLGLKAHQAIDAIRLFEDLHDITICQNDGTTISLGGYVTPELTEGYALHNSERKRLEIIASERTYEWLLAGNPRAKYFVAHELGHCILHTDQLIRLAKMPTDLQTAFHRGGTGGVTHKSYEDTEWQANAFASALLMSAKGIMGMKEKYGLFTPAMIVEQYDVSFEAARYRYELLMKRPNLLF